MSYSKECKGYTFSCHVDDQECNYTYMYIFVCLNFWEFFILCGK